ncbi:MAG: tetratricopeptide repeat protein [Candidatus Melainabacteria bacterium]|nr:MAG: tetratricopeptide repeat protein [Candidatus Melainabacteria bacterium]
MSPDETSDNTLDAITQEDSGKSRIALVDDPSFAEIYRGFGEIYSMQGSWLKAEDALKAAFAVQEKWQQDSNELAETLNKLGQVYR